MYLVNHKHVHYIESKLKDFLKDNLGSMVEVNVASELFKVDDFSLSNLITYLNNDCLNRHFAPWVFSPQVSLV